MNKWFLPVPGGSRPHRAWALLATVLVLIGGGGASAQFSDCGDTLALYSPTSLSIQFEKGSVSGNRLSWPGIPDELAACYRLVVQPEIRAAVAPRVIGQYADIFDREISFSVVDSGRVGDKGLNQVRISFQSFPPNEAVPSFTGSINASDRGGIFVTDIRAGSTAQRNEGIPSHLPSTDVTALAATTLPGGQVRVYAAVTGLPLVRSDDGGQTWSEPLPQLEPAISVAVTQAAASPSNPDLVFFGTDKAGLFRSDDGGQTWRRADRQLTDASPPVTMVKYLRVENGQGVLVDRLYLSMSGIGLFYSDDDGETWTEITAIDPPSVVVRSDGTQVIDCDLLDTSAQVRARDVVVSPNDPRRVYVALRDWAVYRTEDHQVWEPANTDLVVCGPVGGVSGGRRLSVRRLLVLESEGNPGQDLLFAASDSRGIFISANGGDQWGSITEGVIGYPGAEDDAPVAALELFADPRNPGDMVVVTQGAGLVQYVMGTWAPFEAGPGLLLSSFGSAITLPDDDESLVLGSIGAGIYTPGETVDLTRAITSASSPVTLGLGLELEAGLVLPRGNAFRVIGQTFQAYAVWRATEVDPTTQEPEWVMIGLYDLTNPEACSSEPCDSDGQIQIPGCFANKRANCFTLEPTDDGGLRWRFFDSDVFNGFTYYYAVSTLDYGYTGDVAPLSFAGEFVYSPRSQQESNPQATLFTGIRPENYNTRIFQVNVDAAPDLTDVFVVPNPLRRQGSWDGAGESTVRFVGVTASARAQVFTLSGDLVRELENVVTEGEERGNIQWDTRNAEGELVASGVYIYRITDDAGGEFIGRLTIIR